MPPVSDHILHTCVKTTHLRRLFVALACYLLCVPAGAQCLFEEDFNSSPKWTKVGTQVEIRNQRAEYIDGASDGQQRRIYTSLGHTLQADDQWKAELAFRPEAAGSRGGHPWTGHMPLTLTSGTDDPRHNCPNIDCTGFPPSKQYGVGLMYSADNPPDGRMFFTLWANDAGTNLGGASSKRIYASDLKKTYYLRMERLSSTQIKLSVFSDSKRSKHLAGSPISLQIPSGITGLNTVQVSNSVSGYYQRELSGWVDDICISKRCEAVANAGEDVTICYGTSTVLRGTQGIAYEWSPPAYLGTAIGSIVIARPPSSQEYRLVVHDSMGCTDTDYVQVYVRDELIADAGTDTSVTCRSDTLQLNAQGADSYEWRPAIYLEDPLSANTIAFPKENMRYTLIATDSFGCKDTVQLHVDVKSKLSVQVDEDPLICLGDSIVLKATGVGIFEWFSKGSIENPKTAAIKVAPTASTKYVVNVSDSLDCLLKDSISVTVVPFINAQLTKDTSICLGDSIVLQASGGLRYHWTSKGIVLPSNQAHILVTPVQKTRYEVIALTSTQCADTAAVWLDVGQRAAADFELADSLWTDQTVHDILNTSRSALGFEWWVQNVFASTEKDLRYRFNEYGMYQIQLVALGDLGCNDTLEKTTNYRLVLPIRIPNVITPNQDGKNDHFQIVGLWEKSTLYIFNLWGQLVFETEDYKDDWNGTLHNGDALSNGTYYYHFTSSYTGETYYGTVQLVR